ncbi:uncharacterized protein LOC114350605 [Ostrinia furnacalis]|uniref:uncharacterized protein LOC114350605 n=1 Tax=Ostrinia furnacalis TaxID=93504 RepID=UPI00103CA3FC|nr:uncharacterized protein LOC114350605 [Ostrinia furnacalis]
MWYVPEKYPCWQLPILYGELGRRKKTSNIFLVKGGDLKNVNIPDKDKLRKYMLKPDVPTVSSLNKWCSVEPCYGDHTLCLFTENHVSKVCDENYRVHKPTILEHIAIVNTVNAMRNRIANGAADEYPQLPAAKNMKQIIYDYDLEKMAAAWLRQCLPGPPPCSALDERYVSQLECTKYADECCVNSYKIDPTSKCIPKDECFVSAVTGCIYAWFLSAGNKLSEKDIECGHIEPSTYNTVQLIWADSNKIGCAYGERPNGDIRVVCDFAPGAPYFLTTKYYCGFILHRDITDIVGADDDSDLTDLTFLSSLGLDIHSVTHEHPKQNSRVFDVAPKHPRKSWSLDSLQNLYSDLNLREVLNDYSSGTRGSIAKLVTRYRFFEESQSRCDTDEPVYVAGNPGSLCIEKGRRFRALCYDFRDPTPGYRLVAVVAPAALFSLILYDLFSGVVRQTNY